ncbi:MAG: nucleoside triphosphate pyrophosphatase [bacterium]
MLFHLRLPLYLASRSPRRKQILNMLDLNYKTIRGSKFDPAVPDDSPGRYVKQCAVLKAITASGRLKSGIILGCDTIVYAKERILNKPGTAAQAERMIRMLNGIVHTVYTGIAIYDVNKAIVYSAYDKSSVQFRDLSKKEIKNYIKTGDWKDKAGGYGIQARGAFLIKSVTGCYYNVMGLPVNKLLVLLKPYIV